MDHDRIKITKEWVEEFVLKLNLCPFAESPYFNEKIIWKDLKITENFANQLRHEIVEFKKSANNEVSRFIILSELQDFDAYIEIFHLTNEIIEEEEFSEFLHLVPFHPKNRYEGSSINDPVNFANRSPFPMIQLLRKEHLIISEKEKDTILLLNENKLRKLGFDKLSSILNEFRNEN